MKTKKAFTLIELLVVIAIIGVLATVSIIALSNARAKSRDAKRAGDMKQIQTALELFFNDKNRYPTAEEFALDSIFSTSTNSTSTYMQIIPDAPTPADGSCTSGQNTVYYQQTENGNSYTISFCLGNTTGALTAGPKCLTPGGIVDVDCSDVGGSGIAVCSGSTPGESQCTYGGETYNTITIGSQIWLKENLNIGTYIGSAADNNGYDNVLGNNDDCIDVSGGSNRWSCQGANGIQKYCYGNDALAGCSNGYGGLYEWAEALGLPNDCNYATSVDNGDGSYALSCPTSGTQTVEVIHQGICPTGWHVPSFDDMDILAKYVDDDHLCDLDCAGGDCSCSTAGAKLKSSITDAPIPWDGNNNFFFSALPAGFRGLVLGNFVGRDSALQLWISTPDSGGPIYSKIIMINGDDPYLYGDMAMRPAGYSVRCIRN
jgi:uncharacterized protein (TIGR02145 family)/prepilin-type N-terminal cleavage/methylation domain-containing protein